MKDVGLRIRVQRQLRDEFLQICHAQDKPAAQVLREFMREYVTTHGPANDTVKRPEAKRNRGVSQ